MKSITTILLIFCFGTSYARATVYNSDGSASDVQAKINSASSGDTVTIPAGSFTWATGVTLSKAVHVQGAGSGRIIGWGRSSQTFGTGTKTFTLQNGFTASNGTTLRIWRLATNKDTAYMLGTVSSVVGTTLTMNITTNTGSGTASQWLVATEPATKVINNAGSSSALAITESTAGDVEVSGIFFTSIASSGSHMISLTYATSGEPVLIHDCWFWGSSGKSDVMIENTGTNRGVIWNCSVGWDYFSQSNGQWLHLPLNARTAVWSQPSTMGMDDTDGKQNLYVEDCDFHGGLTIVDIDSNAKVVWRHNVNNTAGIGGHGYDTSAYGARHWEFYDNKFLFANISGSGNSLNLQHHIRERGGTGVVTDNYFEDINSVDWGDKHEIGFEIWCLGRGGVGYPDGAYDADDGCVPHYPAPRQFGFGYVTGKGKDGQGNSTSNGVYVGDLEPTYVWNNTGFSPVITTATDGTACTVNVYGHVPDDPNDYVKKGREYYIGIAKPGYTKYTYPHPLRGENSGDQPQPPGNLHIQ